MPQNGTRVYPTLFTKHAYIFATLIIYDIFDAPMNKAMRAKYNRVSTIEQNLDRQLVDSDKFDLIFSDKESGAISFFERKEASKLIQQIEKGKIHEVHVTAIDRLGRSILNLLQVIEYFNKHNVNLYVENIGMFSLIDGEENPSFKMIVSVLGNVAEMERKSMISRQRLGIEIAKSKGTYKGRLHGTKMTDDETLEKYKVVVKELEAGESLRRAAKLGLCSLGTVQKVKSILDKKSELVG
jgi:DNA invertase Pin-like site-specific DNA recombinase